MAEKTYILTGDIIRAAKVKAKGETREEAIAAAEQGNFEIVEEFRNCDAFQLDGDDEDHVEEVSNGNS